LFFISFGLIISSRMCWKVNSYFHQDTPGPW